MPPDEEIENTDIPPNLVTGLGAFIALLASSGVGYLRDLHKAITQLFGRGGLESALREERARAKASVLGLAVIADGQIIDAERSAIAEFAATHGISPDEALARLHAVADPLRDPAVLKKTIARYAAPLNANERLEVFVAVKNLAHRGSRAWPEGEGYRGTGGPTSEALVAAFREALGIRSVEG